MRALLMIDCAFVLTRVIVFAVGSEADANVIYSIASEPIYSNVFLLSEYSVFLVRTFQREISETICRVPARVAPVGECQSHQLHVIVLFKFIYSCGSYIK